MSQLRYKEYPNGKLYVSDELSTTLSITLNDTSGQQVTIVPGEAINMCKFTMRLKNHLENQMSFLTSCKSAGIIPKVDIYELSAKSSDGDPKYVLFVSGSFDEQIKYEQMFYLPKAESIFDSLFRSQDWSIINPDSSVSNVAQKGAGLSSMYSFDNLLARIKDGDYLVSRTI